MLILISVDLIYIKARGMPVEELTNGVINLT